MTQNISLAGNITANYAAHVCTHSLIYLPKGIIKKQSDSQEQKQKYIMIANEVWVFKKRDTKSWK
jgi:hypothetical protein